MKKKEKKYGLLKGVLIMIVVAIILSWLIPNGAYSASGFTNEGIMMRIGLDDLSWIVYYAVIYFSIDKIMFLLVLGGLYGVLSRTEAYKRIVRKLAKAFSNKKKLVVVLMSILIAVLTSILTQTFVVLIFIPFIVSILNKMELDKMTIFATTFGSILVGILGATYGTEGAVYLNNYLISESRTIHELINATVLIRAGILAVGLLLFNFFTLNHMNNTKKDEGTEMIPYDESEEEKKRSIIPIIILGILTLVIVVLGFMDWSNNFLIEIFNDFHDMLFNVKIGEDFFIIKDFLGSNMKAFGTWDLFPITAVLLVFTIILGLCYRIGFNDFVDNFIKGAKKMLWPCLCVVGAFLLMVVVYMSPYVATIVNKLLGLTDGFNLAAMIASSFILNIFHADLGFTGYTIGAYLITEYVDFINPVYVILTTIFGFVQFFIPTSIVLGVGLTSLNVKYGDWLKYIWKFLVGMFICLLVVFILLTLI